MPNILNNGLLINAPAGNWPSDDPEETNPSSECLETLNSLGQASIV